MRVHIIKILLVETFEPVRRTLSSWIRKTFARFRMQMVWRKDFEILVIFAFFHFRHKDLPYPPYLPPFVLNILIWCFLSLLNTTFFSKFSNFVFRIISWYTDEREFSFPFIPPPSVPRYDELVEWKQHFQFYLIFFPSLILKEKFIRRNVYSRSF